MQRITPFLWFDMQAEEASAFYASVFKDSRILETTRYGKAGPGSEGSVMTVSFELEDQPFMALNGGPAHHFNESVSFVVSCESQEEVDYFWSRLGEGGEEGPCGWLKDRYGLSWQIVPKRLSELVSDPDPVRAERAMQAMFGMTKIDLAAIERAAAAPAGASAL